MADTSTHDLHTEVDGAKRSYSGYEVYTSTHDLHTEVDNVAAIGEINAFELQLTTSTRRSTQQSLTAARIRSDFNSRPPHGGRRVA